MDKSLLILGRQPALGLAELESLFGGGALTPIGNSAALIAKPTDAVDFDRLGGSVKLCSLVAEYDTINFSQLQKHILRENALFSSLPPDRKLTLGISAYGFDRVSRDKVFALGLTLKKSLRTPERAVRLVALTEHTFLNSAQVMHNRLLDDAGCELVLVRSGDKTLVGRTVAEQNIESYTLRDRGRPKRDARVGMLPPKLAQIIINLARPSTHSPILDPFCGTGVLLQEALLMGFSVYGTDVESRMIDYSRQNIAWLKAHEPWLQKNIDEHGSTSVTLEVQDATTFQSHTSAGVESVACETYLGRPFTSLPSAEVLEQTISEVNVILKKFLKNLRPQLIPEMQLCLAVPAWQMAPGRFRHLPLIDQIEDLGYTRVSFEHVRDDQLLYYRENQIVARQLLVLTKR